MSLRASRMAERYFFLLQELVLPRIPSSLARPNRLTCLGLFFALLAPFGFWLHPFFGFLGIGFSGLADSLDGMAARSRQEGSRYGAFLDSSLDRISDSLYLLGFWVLFWESSFFIAASVGIFIGLVLTLLISYSKARAEGLGGKCSAGLLERDLRVVYLLIWSLVLSFAPGEMAVLWTGLVLYLVLTMLTVVQRMRHIRTILTD
ncbi:MAG: CDP-alcohol phosphatidyltransferase family protein [Desulfohalobiaceae bacterium]|nr:CDP-alcohol phosphatidyltransferase family protein [Desulfohalobiaceae bacterium]